MCDVSIIIPVYNKEDYLPECLDCILNQTYENFEVLCIDDCSEDGSVKILEEYAARDKRIRIIKNSENQGAGNSRNKGIGQSSGEYLLILDADDIFDQELVRKAYTRCKQEQLDILLYDYKRMDYITKQKRECSVPLPIQRMINNTVFSKGEIEAFSFQMCLAAPWVKMYRKQFIIDSGIWFQNLSSSNDGFFGRSILLTNGRFSYLGENLVTYRTNTNNQISRISEHSIFNFISAVKKIKARLEMQEVFENNKKSFCSYVLRVMLGYLIVMDRDSAIRAYYDIMAEIKDILSPDAVFLNNYQKYIYKDLLSQSDIKKYLCEWNEYSYLFRYEEKKIKYLNEYLYRSRRKIALWGFGYIGREFFERSRRVNTPIDLIVDENHAAFNESLVKRPESIGKENYIVLITAPEYGKSIMERAIEINENTIVFDLQSYFMFGFELKGCIFDRMNLKM